MTRKDANATKMGVTAIPGVTRETTSAATMTNPGFTAKYLPRTGQYAKNVPASTTNLNSEGSETY